MKLRLCFLSLAALTFSAIALTLAFALQPTTAQAGDIEADNSKLRALENAWNLAQLQRDSKALQALLSEKFVYTDYDGTVMNKTQFLTDNKDPAYNATVVTNDNMQVFTYSNVAIVIGKYHTKGTYKGKAFDHWGRFTDTWMYENNNWQCIASHTNLITTK
jgi:ketosteroid isomerase-like protein